jgi:hypothetical protein
VRGDPLPHAGLAALRQAGAGAVPGDFLEPGRTFDPAYTESLRARMPGDMDAIFREVVRLRWTHITGKGGTAHPETQALYEQVESEA